MHRYTQVKASADWSIPVFGSGHQHTGIEKYLNLFYETIT